MAEPPGRGHGEAGPGRGHGEATRAVHPPPPPVPEQRPLGLPVHRTAAFAFADSREYADLLSGRRAGYTYTRNGNPTSDAFAAAVLALEAPAPGGGAADGFAAQPFCSGQAAGAAVLLTLCRAGAHVVAPRELYGGTYALLAGPLARFGVAVDLVDATEPAAVAAAVRPGRTVAVWAETLANPTMSVADLPRLAEVAHQAGAPLVVDSTFASPSVCRPLAHGADLVVHSATKYLGGHADATGGVVVGRAELVAEVRQNRIDLGSVLAPDEAFLLHRGLLTLPLRMQRHCESALQVATALAAHPRVRRVDYPGLASHRDHELAVRLFVPGRFGAVVTITPDRPDAAAGMDLCDRLRLLLVASSLGGVHSKVSPVASTTHRQLPPEALERAGIAASAVRVSVGLEDPDDILEDLAQALDRLT